MIEASGGPSQPTAPPLGRDPTAAPLRALRAELHARRASTLEMMAPDPYQRAQPTRPDHTPNAPNAAAPKAAVSTATLSFVIARLERQDPAVAQAAALLGGWDPPVPTDAPTLRLVPTGTCLHQRAIDSVRNALDSGKAVLVVTDRPGTFPSVVAPPPAKHPGPPEFGALASARVATDLAEQHYQQAAAAHSAARAALRGHEQALSLLAAVEASAQQALAAGREASAGALGAGRLAAQAHQGPAPDAERALRRLLVAAELADSRAQRRDAALAQLDEVQRSFMMGGLSRVEVHRRQRDLRDKRQDHATAEKQLRAARSTQSIAEHRAEQAARTRLSEHGLTGAAPGLLPLSVLSPGAVPGSYLVATAEQVIGAAVKWSEPTFDLVLIEAADQLPPACLIPLCAAARHQVILCAGAGRPPTPSCAEPVHSQWLGANIDQILIGTEFNT